MRGLRQLAALQSLLSSTSLPIVARSCVVAESNTQNSLQTIAVAPALGFAAAAAARWYASDSGSDASIKSRQESSSSATTSLSTGDPSAESQDWLEDWAKLLEKNDVAGQAELLHDTFGHMPAGPPLHELLNYDKKEEERARRRMFELQKQEQIRQSRYLKRLPKHGVLHWSPACTSAACMR